MALLFLVKSELFFLKKKKTVEKDDGPPFLSFIDQEIMSN